MSQDPGQLRAICLIKKGKDHGAVDSNRSYRVLEWDTCIRFINSLSYFYNYCCQIIQHCRVQLKMELFQLLIIEYLPNLTDETVSVSVWSFVIGTAANSQE